MNARVSDTRSLEPVNDISHFSLSPPPSSSLYFSSRWNHRDRCRPFHTPLVYARRFKDWAAFYSINPFGLLKLFFAGGKGWCAVVDLLQSPQPCLQWEHINMYMRLTLLLAIGTCYYVCESVCVCVVVYISRTLRWRDVGDLWVSQKLSRTRSLSKHYDINRYQKCKLS